MTTRSHITDARPLLTSRRLLRNMLQVTAIALVAAVFIPTNSAAASDASATNPCPQWGIQDVFDQPTADWDRDRVPNQTELDHGENPCVPVHSSFCQEQPSLCTAVYVATTNNCSYGTYWHPDSVNRAPNADWDRDGLKNSVEVANGTNPCAHPCPRPTRLDIALNPFADWDKDGHTNSAELFSRTNPCSPTAATPAPTPAPVVLTPTNPIVVTVATPPAGYVCPTGYPYYNPFTGYCQTRP